MRARERGMTLLEVLVALMISALGLLGMLALIGVVLRGSDFSRRVTESSLIAQTQLEQLVSVPRTQLAAQCTAKNGALWTGNGGVTTSVTYTISCNIASCNGLNCITIGVSWPDAAGRTHTITQQRARAQ
ncbi:MAG TPA: prepilin-type N-terminal cleavage/methylation domain-containing protein [Polyangia bacterium]|nr:prepilin-type N-terminal cleavage/methylation domain-containing protein [Polyangia bacterium]